MMGCEESAPLRDDGFTLVELVASLAILALLLVLLLEAVDTGRQTLTRVRAAAADDSHAVVQTLLGHLLAEVRPGAPETGTQPPTPGETLQTPTLVGAADLLTFRSSYAPTGQRWGIYDYAIAVERPAGEVAGTGRLMLRYRPSAAPPDAGWSSVALMGEVQRVAFRFWPRRAGGAPRETWTDATLPRLIEVDVTLQGRTAIAWPRLAVAPKLAP